MIRKDDLHDLRLLLGQFARPYWAQFALAVFVSLAVAFLTGIQPLVLAPAIDSTVLSTQSSAGSWRDLNLNNVGPTLLGWLGFSERPDSWSVMLVVVTVYFVVVCVTSLLNFANRLLIGRIRNDISRDMQVALVRHILNLSISYFTRQRSGDLASRIMNDALETATMVEPGLRGLLQGGLLVGFYLVLLLQTDVRLTMLVLVVVGLHVLITRVLCDRIRTLVVDKFSLFADLTGLIQQTLLSIRVVKSFGAEKFEGDRFEKQAQGLQRVILKGGIYKYVEVPLREVADALGVGIVLLFAFLALSNGRLTVAGLMLFVLIVRQALTPVSQIGAAVLGLQTMIASAKSVLAVLREEPKVKDGAEKTPSLREAIRLENVSFTYESGRPVLKNISMSVRRGETVALVGPSGAGKSTLADLILRMDDPTSGVVTYDGIDVRGFTQESYRRRFGVVSQECLLFNATVEENIAYWRSGDHEEIARAACIAHAVGFIEQLPQGYKTVVGDRGIKLSGGQRQRIALARAVYGKPDILILDEATSSLDSESEGHVQAAIEDAAKDMTVIVIAHRLSTVVKADRIVLLNGGQIEAVGTHQELLAGNALYRRLCGVQFHYQEILPTGAIEENVPL